MAVVVLAAWTDCPDRGGGLGVLARESKTPADDPCADDVIFTTLRHGSSHLKEKRKREDTKRKTESIETHRSLCMCIHVNVTPHRCIKICIEIDMKIWVRACICACVSTALYVGTVWGMGRTQESVRQGGCLYTWLEYTEREEGYVLRALHHTSASQSSFRNS